MTTKTKAKAKTATRTKSKTSERPDDNWKPVAPKSPIAGVSECPRGGKHEWEADEDGTKSCTKCHEPAPTRAKAASKAEKVPKAKAPKSDAPRAKQAAKVAKADGEKKVSALDAAHSVLLKATGPMNCPTLIHIMGQIGIWTSPGGKTPAATLHAAICREIATKGKDSRFAKDGRGTFKAVK